MRKANAYWRVCEAKAQKTSQLIDDLLAFSQLSRQEIAMSQIAIDELVRTVIEELSATAVNKRVQFDIQLLPAAQGDRAMIRQVLVNLLANAVKFCRTKEVPVIEIGGRNDGDSNLYFTSAKTILLQRQWGRFRYEARR